MNNENVDATILMVNLQEIPNTFSLMFDEGDRPEYYYKDHTGHYQKVNAFLVPYKEAEDVHTSIVRPLVLELALLNKKIEAYELPYRKGKENK